jgi:hypothetical protein
MIEKSGNRPECLAGCCGLIMFDSYCVEADCALCIIIISFVMLFLVSLYIYFC